MRGSASFGTGASSDQSKHIGETDCVAEEAVQIGPVSMVDSGSLPNGDSRRKSW
jgi:hypothetical protein